ncbi:MAG: hypothetical protein NC231_07225 [Bacillus sp. (in: Bacteria)]|nr:hypothetical protein [Bacillus sp. (in: firmicutes)]MCM1426453.1 hypothetical protein [Eubacterium sp.]
MGTIIGTTISASIFRMCMQSDYRRWKRKTDRECIKQHRELEKQFKAEEKALEELLNRELSKRRQMLDEWYHTL